MLEKNKYGIIRKNVLKTNFPNVYKELDKIYSKYYETADTIKINSYMESEFGYSINTDPIDGDKDLYIPRVTFNHSDPKKTFTTVHDTPLTIEIAKESAALIALNQLERSLSKLIL